MVVDLDLAVLEQRPGWTVQDDVAEYRPDPGGWYARVSRLQRPARAVDRFHIALISPADTAVWDSTRAWSARPGAWPRVVRRESKGERDQPSDVETRSTGQLTLAVVNTPHNDHSTCIDGGQMATITDHFDLGRHAIGADPSIADHTRLDCPTQTVLSGR
jgi:hypothetical protein